MARREPPQHLLGQLQRLREDIQGRNRRIVGMKEARIVHKTVNPVVGDLTQTLTFGEGDWDIIKADAARIELVNNTGDSRIITDCVVRAKPVIKLSGNFGLVHDAHEDFEDIVKNGERRFEFGNDAIVTRDQLEQLADYYWKYNKTPKHVFVISLPGTCYWYQPGGWYRLDIGAAGESENIDSLCECMYVRTSRRTGENGTTMIGFREVEEAWKHDSNALVRFGVDAPILNLPEKNDVIVVGSQYFTGAANSYCNGVSDEVEINNAITLANQNGGGVVYLTPGTFIVDTNPILLKANVTLQGAGPGATIIEKNLNDHGIEASGNIEKIAIRDLTVTRNAADTNGSVALIRCNNCDYYTIDNVEALDAYADAISISSGNDAILNKVTIVEWGAGSSDHGLLIQSMDRVYLTDATLDAGGGGMYYGLRTLTVTELQASGVIVRNASSTLGGYAIAATADNSRYVNISIEDITTSHDVVTSGTGFQLSGDFCQVSNVTVVNVDNSGTAAHSRGIEVAGDRNVLSNLYVTGCSGTGILINASADRTMLSSVITTSNGTNYTDSGSNTATAAMDSA